MPPSAWEWPSYSMAPAGYCLTFTRGKPANQMLEAYGTGPVQAQPLAYSEAVALHHPGASLLLRAGVIGNQGFCFEQGAILGLNPQVQAALSGDSETMTVCSIPESAMHTLTHARNGQPTSMFEVGMKVHPTQTSALSEEADRLLRAGGKSHAQIALEVASAGSVSRSTGRPTSPVCLRPSSCRRRTSRERQLVETTRPHRL